MKIEKEIDRCKQDVEHLLFLSELDTSELYLNKIGFLLEELEFLKSQLLVLREQELKREQIKTEKMDQYEFEAYIKRKEKIEKMMQMTEMPDTIAKTTFLYYFIPLIVIICIVVIFIFVKY